MTDVQSVVGRLLGDGMTEAQIVSLLEGLAEAVEDGSRQWELTLHDLSAYTAFALGGFTAQVIRDAEAQGYERAGNALQAYCVLLADAEPILRRAAEDTDYAAEFFPGWSSRLRLVLEDGEYPGLTTRLLEDEVPADVSAQVDEFIDDSSTGTVRQRREVPDPHTGLTKVTVNFVPRSVAALDEATALTTDTKTEAINRAVQLWAFLQRRLAEGDTLLMLRGKDGRLRMLWLDPEGPVLDAEHAGGARA